MLWNVRKGLRGQESALPSLQGRVVWRESSHSGLWESYIAECTGATCPHLGHPAALRPSVLPPPVSSICSHVSSHLTGCSTFSQSSQSSTLAHLALLHLHSIPWRPLQFPSFKYHLPSHVSQIYTSSNSRLVGISNLTRSNQSSNPHPAPSVSLIYSRNHASTCAGTRVANLRRVKHYSLSLTWHRSPCAVNFSSTTHPKST